MKWLLIIIGIGGTVFIGCTLWTIVTFVKSPPSVQLATDLKSDRRNPDSLNYALKNVTQEFNTKPIAQVLAPKPLVELVSNDSEEEAGPTNQAPAEPTVYESPYEKDRRIIAEAQKLFEDFQTNINQSPHEAFSIVYNSIEDFDHRRFARERATLVSTLKTAPAGNNLVRDLALNEMTNAHISYEDDPAQIEDSKQLLFTSHDLFLSRSDSPKEALLTTTQTILNQPSIDIGQSLANQFIDHFPEGKKELTDSLAVNGISIQLKE